MNIIDSLKQLIGYSSNDLDYLFVILAAFIVIWFMYSLFAILISFFGGRR